MYYVIFMILVPFILHFVLSYMPIKTTKLDSLYDKLPLTNILPYILDFI